MVVNEEGERASSNWSTETQELRRLPSLPLANIDVGKNFFFLTLTTNTTMKKKAPTTTAMWRTEKLELLLLELVHSGDDEYGMWRRRRTKRSEKKKASRTPKWCCWSMKFQWEKNEVATAIQKPPGIFLALNLKHFSRLF